MSHFIHAPGPVVCRPPSEPVVVVPGARVCPRVPRLPVTSVDGRPPDRTGNVALADVARVVPDAVAGNLASLAEGGNPADSGISSDEVRQAIAKAATAYQKPEDGVPKTDLSEGVRTSLGLADAAVQPVDILTGDGDSKKIKSSLLPSYVDDVIEVANYASLPSPGEEGKIYVTLDTNKTYRWGGTAYVEISNPDLTEYAKRAELFPAWAKNTAYTTYSLVVHDNAIYRCTTAHTSGAEWDSTKWAVASGAEVLAMLRDYAALSNKPSINDVTLTGNKTGPDIGLKNNFEIGSGLQEVINNLYAYKGVDGTSTEGQTVYTLGAVASVGSKLYTWDGTTLTDTLKTVSSVNVGTGRIYTSMIPAVYYERAASNDVSRPPTVNVATVAPSPNAVAGNVADAKSVWDELLKLAPDWKTSTAGGTYAKYDVVRYNHNYYYNKTGTNTNTIPSGDTTNWGSLANLAALAHKFLPLAGGTMTGGLHVNGSLDVDYTENGISASIFKVIGSAVNNVRFIYYDGTGYITLYLKDIASLASPAFTGTPTAPTPTAGDDSTKVATTAFVQNRIGQKLEVWLSVDPQTGVVSANYDDGL